MSCHHGTDVKILYVLCTMYSSHKYLIVRIYIFYVDCVGRVDFKSPREIITVGDFSFSCQYDIFPQFKSSIGNVKLTKELIYQSIRCELLRHNAMIRTLQN